MRTFRAWGIFVVMGLFVFLVAGCGGGSLDPEESSETEQSIPNNSPDTYDTERVLEGTWRVSDSSHEFSAGNFSFRLNSAVLTFTSTDIKGTVAQSKVTSLQEWYTDYTSSDINIALGIQSLGLNFNAQTGTMIHQGKDRRRCNIDGDNKVLMNIAVSSDAVIRVNYQGTTGIIYDNHSVGYNFTLNFRKEEYSR